MMSEVKRDPSHWLRQSILMGLGVMLVVVPLYFSPSMSDYHTPKFILIQVCTTVLGCLLLISMALDGEVYVLDHPIYYTMLAFLAANFISLFQAHNIYQGLYALWIQACFFILAILCFHCIRKREHVLILAGVMTGTGSVVALVGLMQHNDLFHFYHRWRIPASTIGNVNFVAEYYNVVYPIALILLLIVRRAWLWFLVLMAAFLMTCHLIVMGSRGGWLGGAIAICVIGGAAVARRYTIRRRVADVVLVGLLCTLLGWPILTNVASGLRVGGGQTLSGLAGNYWDLAASRSGDALAIRDTSTRQRVLLWEDTFRLIFDRPVLGVGTGNYEFNIPNHLSRESLEIKSGMEVETGVEHMIFRAHNEYLEVWSETGLIGLSIFVILLVQILRSVFGLLLGYVRGKEEPLVVGLAAAILATLTHSLFSSNFQNPASATVFWVVVGFVWTFSVAPDNRRRLGLLKTSSDRFSFGLVAAGVCVVLLTCFHGYRMRQGAIMFQDARRLIQNGAYAEALNKLTTSLRYPSPRPFATYEMLGKMHHHLGNWPEAERSFRRSLRYNDGLAGAHYFLGRSLAQQGRVEDAVVPLERSIALEPMRSEYRVTLGTTLGQLRRFDEALAEIRQALALDPNLKSAHYALGGVERSRGNNELALEAFDEALAFDPSDLEIQNSRARELILLGRFKEAEAAFRKVIGLDREMVSARINLAVALLNRAELTEALEVCREILRRWPDYRVARELMAEIYTQQGETELARKGKSGEIP
jgi:tetratricopeptide (TPR) repeat protein/O-antigen ligase